MPTSALVLSTPSPRTSPRKKGTHQQREPKSHGARRDRQHKRPLDRNIIRHQHTRQLRRRRDFADMRGAGGDDERGVDAGRVFGDLGDERVDEDVLRDGDGDCAAEGVEEDYDCVCGHVQ